MGAEAILNSLGKGIDRHIDILAFSENTEFDVILFETEKDSYAMQKMEITLKFEKLYARSEYGLHNCVLRA